MVKEENARVKGELESVRTEVLSPEYTAFLDSLDKKSSEPTKKEADDDEFKKLCEFHQYDFNKYKGEQSKTKMARNLVDYEAGKTILEIALGIIKKSNEKQKVFYDEFSYFFDRLKNLNVYFSFNFFNLLKDSYKNADEKILYSLRNNYEIKVYLIKEQEFHNYTKEIVDVRKISLFDSSKFSTFFCKIPSENLSGKYRIFVKVFYDSQTREYTNIRLSQDNVENYEINILSKNKYHY